MSSDVVTSGVAASVEARWHGRSTWRSGSSAASPASPLTTRVSATAWSSPSSLPPGPPPPPPPGCRRRRRLNPTSSTVRSTSPGAAQRTATSAREPGCRGIDAMARGSVGKEMPSLARSCISQLVVSSPSSRTTPSWMPEKTMRKRCRTLGRIASRGSRSPLTRSTASSSPSTCQNAALKRCWIVTRSPTSTRCSIKTTGSRTRSRSRARARPRCTRRRRGPPTTRGARGRAGSSCWLAETRSPGCCRCRRPRAGSGTGRGACRQRARGSWGPGWRR
mmetsp:Transcript_4239/g.17198  ORF Transcript_4239/g.17198 Transcript_4239/m.17198 type:complete len:277 (-) Transcript_4239:239-1069(-)